MALVNQERVEAVAEILAAMPADLKPLNFYSFNTPKGEIVAEDMYPPLEHPAAVDFFMFVCLHQYGFWCSNDHGYTEPLMGTLDGDEHKGSDLLWRVALKALKKDETVFRPRNLVEISDEQLWGEILADDNGPIAFADKPLRTLITREYGRCLVSERLSPADIVVAANRTVRQLTTFVNTMREVDGYSGDPFNKKVMLLAMALHNRPERMLLVDDDTSWKPIVDYHLMRFALRTGIVDIDEEARYIIERRYFIRPQLEFEIRKRTFEAFEQLIKLSGKSMFYVDAAVWKGRKYCPEMTEPECDRCVFGAACAKDVALFQPVYRTINY